MKHLTPTLGLAVGLAVINCGGAAPRQVTSPNATSDGSNAKRNGAEQANIDQDTSRQDDANRSGSTASDASAPSRPESPADIANAKSTATSDDRNHQDQHDDDNNDDDNDDVAQKDERAAANCQKTDAGLMLSVDRNSVSLEEGHLRAKMDGPICSLVIRILRKDGQPTVEKAFAYGGPERELRWDPVPRDQIEKVEIRITAKDNAYRAVTLVPWSVTIDHREVEFDTNKALIRDSEVSSLEDSLAKIKEVLAKVDGKGLGTITLFIAGHTDTQGSDDHNMTLSRGRAQSIAAWFIKRGLCVPVAYEGFGETALRKLTADNVAEQANRRVDYILAVEPPTIKKGATPAWKSISKGC